MDAAHSPRSVAEEPSPRWWGLARGHFQGGAWAVLRRFTWELPQTLLGAAAGVHALLTMEVQWLRLADGVVVIKGWKPLGAKGWGGICFGTVILGDERIEAALNNPLYMHEFGHALQSRASGPLYLFKYGIPSLLSARGRGVHRLHPVERDANERACAYFSQQPGYAGWHEDFSPLPVSRRPLPLHWWEFLPPIFPVRHLWQAMRDRDGVNER